MKSQIAFLIAVLLVLEVALQTDSASVSMSSNSMSLNGKARITFYEPREIVWAGLSAGHRYPVIYSGDQIALRLGYTSGSLQHYWLSCTSSRCYRSTCPGGKVMKSNKWSSCTKEVFYIRAIGKADGQPINSGDMVTLGSRYHGFAYRLRCYTSASTYCRTNVYITAASLKGSNWLGYAYAVFQIFSRNAVDGHAVQYGDTVAFRYPYYYSFYWLYYNGGYWYARSCSYSSKYSCARQNSRTGFQIFKKL